MRILCLANHLDAVGGLERTQMTNCRWLAGRGHELDLVYVSGGAFAPEWRRFATTITQVSSTLPRRAAPFASTGAVAAAIARARRRRPDVVYAYRYWDLPFAAAVAAGTRTAVAYHLCLPPPEPAPRVLREAMRRVDATISVSRHTLALWEGAGLRTGRGTVALTSVDLATYAPAPAAARDEARREAGLDPEDFVVFFAGRVIPEKGVDVLVDAFRLLSERRARCHLVVLGPPGTDPAQARAYNEDLERRAAGLSVSWLPPRSDVVPLLQAADVAVVPSRWAEPLSRSIMEAMACGVPVVASQVGGSPEILTGWMSDYLFPSEDAGALADVLGSLYGWRSDDPALGKRFRDAAEARLSLDDEGAIVEAAMIQASGARARRR
jgi:glycosyltransferase involved in cell wall biosynthesis